MKWFESEMVSREVELSVVFKLSVKITQYCSLITPWSKGHGKKMSLKKVSGKSAKNNEKVLFKLYMWGNTYLNPAILFSCPLVFFSSI